MESGRRRSPYYRNGNNQHLNLYFNETNRDIHDCQRPASVHDLEFSDMYDSGIHGHSSSPRINIAYGTDSAGMLMDSREASLDRRGNVYGGTLRSNFDTQSERLTKPALEQVYTMKSLNSNPGLSAVLGTNNPSNRRAHSYDMNLEKQGLTDYNNLLAAAGLNANTYGLYGYPNNSNINNPLLNYTGLNIPGLTSLGGLDVSTLQQRPTTYSALTQQPISSFLNLNPSTDIIYLQQECVRLNHELNIVKEKLNACVTSIRTFWSPELKRERSMRKEENAKYAILADHLHQLQLEKQTMLETLHNMESDLRKERDKGNRSKFSGDREEISELDVVKRQVDELTLENQQLKNSIEEADRRMANSKASLNATEESLRRLVDAVKAAKSSGSGATVNIPCTSTTESMAGAQATTTTIDQSLTQTIKIEKIEADRHEIARLRNQLNDSSARRCELEQQFIQRNFEFSRLKEDFDALLQEHQQVRRESDTLRHDTRQNQTLQLLVDTKESKILTLENEIRLLEDEITRLRDDDLITPNTSTSSGIEDLDKTLQTYRSNERILKSKVEMLNGEISKRECELYTLQSRLEMVDKQQQDQTHHINVLKEQLKTKEHKISMISADAEDLRKRLKEKENVIDKKSKAITQSQTAKKQSETELIELKDQVDIKDRKLSLLQRKIENLEDLLNDKESQLATLQSRLSRFSTERIGVADGSLTGWEETLKDKDRQIERLKESCQRSELETIEEVESQKRLIAELRSRLDSTQREWDEKSNQLLEVREEVGELRTLKFKLETELSQLQSQLNQRNAEIASLQIEKHMVQKQITTEADMKYLQRISELENQVNHYMESSSKLQSEVDRLLRNIDTEKFEKDSQLHELKDELRESQTNLNNLKRTQQADRKKLTQQLEEFKQHEENAKSDLEILKNIMTEKENRIRELEQALRESVRITAEREIYASGRDDESRLLEQQMKELRNNLEHLQRERNNLSGQLAAAHGEMNDRENQLKTLEQECFQNYLPELEKLRRLNHEGNLRVAALIKLTQGREHSLTDQDRMALSTIPLFPNFTLNETIGFGAYEKHGVTTRSTGLLTPYITTTIGGSVSPHLAGSAFQLIGTAAGGVSSSVGGRASVPGQPISSPDVIILTKMLQEKENTLQQHLQELTRLRFVNSELEIRLKSTRRELDAKVANSNMFESSQAYNSSALLDQTRLHTPIGSTSVSRELAQLRKTNQELGAKFNQLQAELDDRTRATFENRFKSPSNVHSSEFSEMATLRREIASTKAEREIEVTNLKSQIELLKREKEEMSDRYKTAQSTLTEKLNSVHLIESEKDKLIQERDGIQKKYETVLKQLTDKSERLTQLEHECHEVQTEEINRQKAELVDLKHHVSYLHNTIKERESRIESVEKECFKLRDELSIVRKQLGTVESEARNFKDESAYREERIKQLQLQHTEELTRLKCVNHEQSTRISHLEMKLDEERHRFQTQSSELRCKSDEVARLQSSVDESTNRLNVFQKRVEERENRLRKLENENHDLLDEIHILRKGNTELESQVDGLRNKLFDKEESGEGTTVTSLPMTRTYQSNVSSSMKPGQKYDYLNEQYVELKARSDETKKSLEEIQIQYDQLKIQKNNLQVQLNEEQNRRIKLEERLQLDTKSRLTDSFNIGQSDTNKFKIEEMQRELSVKGAQIELLNKQLSKNYASSITPDMFGSDTTSQQLLVGDLQTCLHQAFEERDLAKEQLALHLKRTDCSSLDVHQMVTEKQQQIATLTQTVQNVTSDCERYQREAKQATTRMQEISRQLQETQLNSDLIAKHRDNLQEQVEELRRGRSMTGTVGSITNLFGSGMRPASAGPGNYENTSFYGYGGGPSQLSRELDRLHREYEHLQSQYKLSLDNEQLIRKQLESVNNDNEKLQEKIEMQKTQLNDKDRVKEGLDDELKKLQNTIRNQTNETKDTLNYTQQQLIEKSNQLESAVNQLNNARQYCSELEQRLNDKSARLDRAESQTQNQSDELRRYQQIETECNQLRDLIKNKDNEIQQLNNHLDQIGREFQNQENRLDQMNFELNAVNDKLKQSNKELITMKECKDKLEIQCSTNQSNSVNQDAVDAMNKQLDDSQRSRQMMERQIQQLENDLVQTRNQLNEKIEEIDLLENNVLKRQAEELSALQKELNLSYNEIKELGGSVEPGSKSNAAPLKVEIDTLKREIDKNNNTISRMEKDCQDKHVRRIEAMQVQLRRFEEEMANLSQVLDEQRVGLEERDRIIRQLQSEQNEAALVEFEKMKSEHAGCKDKIEQCNRRIETMTKQVQDQSDEILKIKLESITASLCEKEANLALMEFTAPKNAATNKNLENLRTERDHLQMQQKQLSNTLAMLMEAKMSQQ